MGQKVTKPVVLNVKQFEQKDIEELRSESVKVVDIYEDQLRELFCIKYPAKQEDNAAFDQFLSTQPKGDLAGAWVFYPWNSCLLHCISEAGLAAIRTNRNKNLITSQQQAKLASANIGIAGMSVGASIASALIYSGISTKHIKLADYDTLDSSNLNRLRESLLSVGENKVKLAAQNIYEVSPFSEIQEFSNGLNDKNIKSFFNGLSLVVDEIDDFQMKIKIRIEAKKNKIPVVMFTSLGDNILVDIERYDTDKNLEPFHGLVNDAVTEILNKGQLGINDIKKYSVTIVGSKYIPTPALASVLEIGKSLVGRPQLYSTIAVDGGLAAYIVRRIILDSLPVSGRYFIEFSELFNLPNKDLNDTHDRMRVLKELTS